MENFFLASSFDTPEVHFNFENGWLKLHGRSISDNPEEFYKPLNEWIDNYSVQPKTATTIEIKLDYINTSSSKCLLHMLKKLEQISSDKSTVLVRWVHRENDMDIAEAGEDYKALIGLSFVFIPVEE